MKYVWLTDIHLNFLESQGRVEFYQQIIDTNCDVVLISGDIAEAPSLISILKEMAKKIQKPIYFVLGNHDYYRGQVDAVRNEMIKLTEKESLLFWLGGAGPQILEKDIILVGQDGWADGRYGDYQNSRVGLNDSRLIADLFQQKILGKDKLLEKMQQLADADAEKLTEDLNVAIGQTPKKIVVLTHVPPFRETSLYQRKISGDDYLPFFASKATGDVLLKVAEATPEIKFLVLCGHTHDQAVYRPLDNLTVKVGKAEYYQPEMQEVI